MSRFNKRPSNRIVLAAWHVCHNNSSSWLCLLIGALNDIWLKTYWQHITYSKIFLNLFTFSLDSNLNRHWRILDMHASRQIPTDNWITTWSWENFFVRKLDLLSSLTQWEYCSRYFRASTEHIHRICRCICLGMLRYYRQFFKADRVGRIWPIPPIPFDDKQFKNIYSSPTHPPLYSPTYIFLVLFIHFRETMNRIRNHDFTANTAKEECVESVRYEFHKWHWYSMLVEWILWIWCKPVS